MHRPLCFLPTSISAVLDASVDKNHPLWIRGVDSLVRPLVELPDAVLTPGKNNLFQVGDHACGERNQPNCAKPGRLKLKNLSLKGGNTNMKEAIGGAIKVFQGELILEQGKHCCDWCCCCWLFCGVWGVGVLVCSVLLLLAPH